MQTHSRTEICNKNIAKSTQILVQIEDHTKSNHFQKGSPLNLPVPLKVSKSFAVSKSNDFLHLLFEKEIFLIL